MISNANLPPSLRSRFLSSTALAFAYDLLGNIVQKKVNVDLVKCMQYTLFINGTSLNYTCNYSNIVILKVSSCVVDLLPKIFLYTPTDIDPILQTEIVIYEGLARVTKLHASYSIVFNQHRIIYIPYSTQ